MDFNNANTFFQNKQNHLISSNEGMNFTADNTMYKKFNVYSNNS